MEENGNKDNQLNNTDNNIVNQDQLNVPDNTVKIPKKTFKYYYDNFPEFRERHMQKLKEKITCECSCEVSRCNMLRHMKTKKHQKYLALIESVKDKEIKELRDKVAELKQKLRYYKGNK
jgi:hypothetical protein